MRGEVIPGLYCAGEVAGRLRPARAGRCLVFGRIAGRHAAKNAA